MHPNKPQGDQGVVLKDIFRHDPVPPMAIVTSPVEGFHEEGITIQVYSFFQDKEQGTNTALQTLKKIAGTRHFLIMSDFGD